MHPLFGSQMVLQAGKPVSIWGKATPGEKITFQMGSLVQKTKAEKDSSWKILFPAQQAGGPHKIQLQGKNTVVLEDVYFGEVWIASGQSNMEWKLKQPILNQAKEIANAQFPQIRFLDVKNKYASQPQSQIETKGWKICNPENAPELSAVAYFFAREIHQKKKMPIGLILCEWGGTPAEAWTSKEALKGFPEFESALAKLPEMSLQTPEAPVFQTKLSAFNTSLIEKDPGVLGKWWSTQAIDADWKTMEIPSVWENAGLPLFDGVVWFRKEIDVPPALAAESKVLLRLSTIDDMDSVWVNGIKIGGMRGYDRNRNYTLPDGVLKPGKNTISVRVIDWTGNGGLWGAKEDMKLAGKNESIPLSGLWKYKPGCAADQLAKIGDDVRMQNQPATLFNGMLHPIIPLGIKGVIWYQGESNTAKASQYQRLFPAMIQDWRSRFGQGDFPFYFVQLANYLSPDTLPAEKSPWAELREAQEMTLSLPNTGMATAVDIGEANDIHPKNKQEVGRRLALIALKNLYQSDLPFLNPSMDKIEKIGTGFSVTFKNAEKGMKVKDRYGYAKGFAVAGADKKFYWAPARLEGGKVFVYSPQVPEPVYLRYGWANNPDDINLYNSAGLPLLPFRTDK